MGDYKLPLISVIFNEIITPTNDESSILEIEVVMPHSFLFHGPLWAFLNFLRCDWLATHMTRSDWLHG